MDDNQDIPRRLPASAGIAWLLRGVALYRRRPLLLSTGFAMGFGTLMGLAMLPLIGNSFSDFALPLLTAGFMATYRLIDEDRPTDAQVFFAGVRGPALPLMALGAFQLLGSVLAGQVMQAMGLDLAAIQQLAESGKGSSQELQEAVNQALPAALTGVALMLMLSMATLFAPALVLFGGARPMTALGISFKACLRNLLPLVVFIFSAGVLLLLGAMIPMLLGLLFVMPILLGGVYAAYQAIFAIWSE